MRLLVGCVPTFLRVSTSAGGKWAAIEVKLGVNRIDEGAASLLRLAEEVNTSKMGKPSFLAVVTATGYAYKRQDGVFVLTIGSLKP